MSESLEIAEPVVAPSSLAGDAHASARVGEGHQGQEPEGVVGMM